MVTVVALGALPAVALPAVALPAVALPESAAGAVVVDGCDP
ncbi:hypothetical protein [Parafrankia sp. EUN1f]|nr:hypothetical protein [Parafrankia sp. EUN1f]